MKTIFECESDLGPCDADQANRGVESLSEDLQGWYAVVQTAATMSGTCRIMRIEQRCYLRAHPRPDELFNQTWIAPEIMLEPGLESKEETVRLLQQMHLEFAAKARAELVERYVVIPSGEALAGVAAASQ
jgi:hypothetical protein